MGPHSQALPRREASLGYDIAIPSFAYVLFLPPVLSLRFGRWVSDKEAAGCCLSACLRTGVFEPGAPPPPEAAQALNSKLPYTSSKVLDSEASYALSQFVLKACSSPHARRQIESSRKSAANPAGQDQEPTPRRGAFSVNPLNRYTPPLGTNFEDVSSIRGQPRVDQTMLLQLLDLQCNQGLRRAVCCPKPVNYASRKRLTLTVLRCQDVSESN